MGFFNFLKSKTEDKVSSISEDIKFSGFKLEDKKLQNILDSLDYSNQKVNELFEEYSDVIPELVTGMASVGNAERRNIFAEHMAMASSKGNNKAVALSCFVQHGDMFHRYLPVPINKMQNETLDFFLFLLIMHVQRGFSKSLVKYLNNNRHETEVLANNNNKYAQYLMGFWYVFDNREKDGKQKCLEARMFWYEKSAINGYIPAMEATANFYDDSMPDLPTNLKKTAYWYRNVALSGNAMCAYNLATMYLRGDGVKQNIEQTTLWVSFAFKYADKKFKSIIEEFASSNNIKLEANPDMQSDLELNPSTRELNS